MPCLGGRGDVGFPRQIFLFVIYNNKTCKPLSRPKCKESAAGTGTVSFVFPCSFDLVEGSNHCFLKTQCFQVFYVPGLIVMITCSQECKTGNDDEKCVCH